MITWVLCVFKSAFGQIILMFEQALRDWVDDLSFTGMGGSRILKAQILVLRLLAGTPDRKLFRAHLSVSLENKTQPVICHYDIMVERFDQDYIITDWSITKGQEHFFVS